MAGGSLLGPIVAMARTDGTEEEVLKIFFIYYFLCNRTKKTCAFFRASVPLSALSVWQVGNWQCCDSRIG